MKILAAIKKVSNYWTKSKYYDDLNKLIVGKMKDETTGVVIKEFVGLKHSVHPLFFLLPNFQKEGGDV